MLCTTLCCVEHRAYGVTALCRAIHHNVRNTTQIVCAMKLTGRPIVFLHLENIGVLLQYQKALPQCPLLPQYCSNTLQWALPQCCCNTAIVAALPQYCCNTVLLQYCRNGAIAAIRCAHCSNPQCLNALPQHCGNDLLPQCCSNAFGHCRLPESTKAVCSFHRAALEP